MVEKQNGSKAAVEVLIDALTNRGQKRIYTLMGPNGAGKSFLLERLHIHFTSNTKTQYFYLSPSRRLLKFSPDDSGWGSENRTNTIIERARANDNSKSASYRATLMQWAEQKTPDLAAKPKEPDRQSLKVYRQIAEILGFESADDLNFVRNGTPLKMNQLSDGDKQAYMLAGHLLWDGMKAIYLIDEPELHLNEARAISLWEQIERNNPESTFLYATHSVNFATRPSVDRIFLLGMDHKIEEIDRNLPIDRSIVEQLVGSRIQVLRTEKPIIFCEGTFHKEILSEVLPHEKFEAIPLGSWSTVYDAVTRQAGWNAVRSPAKYCGVVDRDARDDEKVEYFSLKKLFCFPWNEAETLLVVPDLAIWYLTVLGGTNVDHESYVSVLLEAARQVFENSIERYAKFLSDHQRVSVDLEVDAELEFSKLELSLPKDILTLVRVRRAEMKAAIETKDIDQILKMFKGTQMFSALSNASSPKFGVQLGEAFKTFETIRNLPGFSEELGKIGALKDWADKITRTLF